MLPISKSIRSPRPVPSKHQVSYRAGSNQPTKRFLRNGYGRQVPYDRRQAGYVTGEPFSFRMLAGGFVAALWVPILWVRAEMLVAWVLMNCVLGIGWGLSERVHNFLRGLTVDNDSVASDPKVYNWYLEGEWTRKEYKREIATEGKKLRASPFLYYYFAVPILTGIVKILSLIGPANKGF